MRVGLSPEAVESYAGRLDELPPIKLVRDYRTGAYWLADGCHTVTAARQAGRKAFRAVVIDGNYLDAFKEAARANDTHGVRVSNADKRHRVEQALACPDLADWSNRRIAEFCGVSHVFVNQVRPELSNADVETVSTSPIPDATADASANAGATEATIGAADAPETLESFGDVETVSTSPRAPIAARPDPVPTRVDSLGRRQPANRPKASRKVVADEYAQDVPDYEDCSQDDDGPAERDEDDEAPATLPQRPPIRVLPKAPGNPALPPSAVLQPSPGRTSLPATISGLRGLVAPVVPNFAALFTALSDADKARVTADLEAVADLCDGWLELIRGGTD